MSDKSLQLHFTYSYQIVKRNLDGMTHEDCLLQPPEGGNCLNWVLGHIVSSRNGILPLVGREPHWEKAERELYDRGSAPITGGSEALSLDRLLGDLDQSQETLIEGLKGLSQEALAAPAPFSPFKREDETLATLLVVFAFHEAYHAGQTGLLRRLSGLPGAIA